MSLQWITITKRLLEASQLINTIPLDVYIDILTLITASSYSLSEEQLSLINNQLKLPEDKLQLLVQSVGHIYKKSRLVLLKPTKLRKQLEENLKLSPDKAEQFMKAWSLKVKEEFGDLERCKKLDSVSWELNLQTHSSSNIGQGNQVEFVPVGKLQLGLSNLSSLSSLAVGGDLNRENMCLELNETQLVHLYKTLEDIQSKCDSILTK